MTSRFDGDRQVWCLEPWNLRGRARRWLQLRLAARYGRLSESRDGIPRAGAGTRQELGGFDDSAGSGRSSHI